MKNWLQQFRKAGKGLMMLFIALAMFTASAVAQSVNITVNILPPYSPYYADYSGSNASKVLLIIQNTTGSQLRLKLAGKLTGDNGIRIATYTNYVPMQPITLNPREVKRLNGLALKDIFDLNNLSVAGVDKARLAATSRLPEGNYSFCIQAEDYDTKQLLSATAPMGCTNINISYPEPPVLVNPMNNARVLAITPQNVTFNWINPGTAPMGTEYLLQVAVMPDVPADPNQVLNATSFPILSQRLRSFSYTYSIANLGLTPGKRYAWRVTAIDPSGRTIFKNNGASGAAVFEYKASDVLTSIPVPPPAAIPPPKPKEIKMPGQQIQVSGMLGFKYHTYGNELPAKFTGVKGDTSALKSEEIQLCYGQVRVKMDMKLKLQQVVVPNSVIKDKKLPADMKATPKGKDSTLLTYNKIDTIPSRGLPSGWTNIEPAGNGYNGLGEVIATTTTTSTGNFTFKATTLRTCRIIETINDKEAMVYCYYINIKNKHYTDPRQYVYIPVSDEESSVDVGRISSYIENYNLTVSINRDKEFTTNQGKTKEISVENTADNLVDIYVLRKHRMAGTRNITAPEVPFNEGDNVNLGLVTYPFDPMNKYQIVAKRTAETLHNMDNGFRAKAVFNNLVNNLGTDESYFVYAEYKNAKVKFARQEFNYAPGQQPEYNPAFALMEGKANLEMAPSFVSVKVKGVMKYQFKDGAPVPLGNIKVSLQSIFWQSVKNSSGKLVRTYDLDNKNKYNKNFATTTTTADGYFELDAGNIKYDEYLVGGMIGFGFDQFVIVNNHYYGSPDKSFVLEAGNTYNVGELVARVKEYTMKALVQGKSATNGQMTKLQGQRVYLCREAGINPQQWGVPVDEGEKKNIPIKQLNDITGTLFNVIGYGITDKDGRVSFGHLVTRDLQNSKDKYYIYAESMVTSTTNYSTRYALEKNVSDLANKNWPEFYPASGIAFNNTFTTARGTGPFVTVEALNPYIEGGVYPNSNTSTNALPGVTVELYNVKPGTLNIELLKLTAKDYGIETAVSAYVHGPSSYLQEVQVTGPDGRFYFADPNLNGVANGWKFLVYKKAGFISNYDIIYSGSPMPAGVKQTVKGFILPPVALHTSIKDADTGVPIAAHVVVGNQFSWAEQKVQTLYGGNPPQYYQHTDGIDLRSTFGDVTFTVIPDDNVNYRTQTFTRKIYKPIDEEILKTQKMSDFLLETNKNKISICIYSAQTKKTISGWATITEVPDYQNPAKQGVLVKATQCTDLKFVANVPYYYVTTTAPGHVTQKVMVTANSAEKYSKAVTFMLEADMKIAGQVIMSGKPVKDATVYIQELKDIPAVKTDAQGNYTIAGLPRNGLPVTISATKPEANAVGQTWKVTLNLAKEGTSGGVQSAQQQQQQPQASGATVVNLSGANAGSLGTGGGFNPTSTAYQDFMVKQGSVDAITATKTVNFELVVNTEFDLSNLYGYPMEVEKLTISGPDVALLTGRIKVPGNNVFAMTKDPYLHFTEIAIKRVKNTSKAGIMPVTPMVTADDDFVPVTAFGKYGGRIDGFSGGIKISSSGIIGGTAVLTGANLSGNMKLKNDVTLKPLNGKPGPSTPTKANANNNNYKATEYTIPMFYSATSVNKKDVASYYSFACTNGYGSPYPGVRYLLNNIYNAEGSGYFDAGGMHVYSLLHTNLENVSKPDIELNIGEVYVNNNSIVPIKGKSPIEIPLDDWKIKSNDWRISYGRLTLDGIVDAGSISVPFTDMQIDDKTIGFGTMNLNQIGIAGVYKLKIDTSKTLTAFGYDKAAAYGTQYNKQYGCWSLSMLPKNPDDALTKLDKLPDVDQNQTLDVMNISLYSKGGESRVILKQNHPQLTLNGFAGFSPYEVENGKDYLKVNGALNFTIPGFTGTEKAPYVLSFAAENGKLIHRHEAIAGLKLNTNGIRVEFDTQNQLFNNGVLQLKGTLRDKVTNSPYAIRVNFQKDASATKIWVDTKANNTIALGSGQEMNKIDGAMAIDQGNWKNFIFNGDVAAVGMNEPKEKTHMEFEVKGDLVANSAKIGVQNMQVPSALGAGSFNITYDFEKKAILGSMHLDKVSTPIADAMVDIEMYMGSGRWYFLGSGVLSNMSLPLPLNGGAAAFMIGNTDITPDHLQIIAPVFHNGELPDNFYTHFKHLKGSLLVAGIDMKLPILPNIDVSLPMAEVHVNYGVYAEAYLGLIFEKVENIKVLGGVKVGAYVNVSAGASLGLVCAGISLSADVSARADVVMDNLDFTTINPVAFYQKSSLTLSMEPKVQLKGQAYVGAGVCNSSCNSVKVWGVTVPPGCYKKNISEDMTLSMKLQITKPSGKLLPDKAVAGAKILGKEFSGTLKLF